MIQRNVLLFRGGRYLWWSLLVIGGSVLLYGSEGQRKSGSTWQGYTLGILGALLVGCLSLLGIRKRRYSSTLGTMQGWTSAHVYLGMALFVVATLHCGLQFGRNVHTLAYALMCGVIGSGIFGLYTYLQHPAWIAENRAGGAREQLFRELFALDRQVRLVGHKCSPAIDIAAASSVERTSIGGGVLAQLLGWDRSFFLAGGEASAAPQRNRDQQSVVAAVANRLPRAEKGAETEHLQQLLLLLCRRQAMLRRIRVDIRLQAWMKIWLYFHVPITAALLVAVAVHVVSTFTYR